jgi:hypothetical protein
MYVEFNFGVVHEPDPRAVCALVHPGDAALVRADEDEK